MYRRNTIEQVPKALSSESNPPPFSSTNTSVGQLSVAHQPANLTLGNIPVFDILSTRLHDMLPINLINVKERKLYTREQLQEKVSSDIRAAIAANTFVPMVLSAENMRTEVEKAIDRRLGYAILSHRWLQKDEPNYDDTLRYSQDGRIPTDGPGYRKIEEFCKKAEEYRCDWAWADTCCIDKRSSTQLDESIRSMFRWYRNAKVCIVHLADTAPLGDIDQDAWFTRGWTLQELLAPSCIRFYTKDWQPFTADENDKDNDALSEKISLTTGIPRYQLRSFTPGVNMIREKMLWASKRNTTRSEDVAYSLIGMFDVTMPIAYGEGGRAFYRLQTTLAEKTASMEFFVWSGKPSPHNAMFASSPRCFYYNVSRDDFASYLLDTAEKYATTPLLPGGWTLEQCDTAARIFIHRGDVSFSMTNAGLRITLILYDARVHIRPSTENHKENRYVLVADKLGEIDDIKSEIADRKFVVGVLDYEWGDANGKPVQSVRDIVLTEHHDRLFVRPENPVPAKQSILTGRRDRWYSAVVLQVLGPQRYQKIGTRSFPVKRPARGWKKPETVYVQ